MPTWSTAPVVEAYQAMRGASFLVAVTFAAKIGDVRRFDTPPQLMAFLGLVPESARLATPSAGRALRSPAIDALAARVVPETAANRPVVTMLDCWLAIIPVLGVGVALYVLRLRRTAAGVICAVSAGAGLLSAAVILRGDEGGPIIAPASAGPAVTLAGAVVALAGGVLVIMSTRVGSQ